MSELIIDSFAGGGGASLGIAWATGRAPDIAINHDAAAIAMHEANHPSTLHVLEDVWKADLKKLTKRRKVGLLWLSPDCFSAGTLVLTKRGMVPIEQVQVGDYVLTHKNRWRKVVSLVQKQSETIRLKGHGHYGLDVTPDHQIYSATFARRSKSIGGKTVDVMRTNSTKWIAAAKMVGKVKHHWATPHSVPQTPMTLPPAELNEGFFYWLGRWVACGSFSKDDLVISCGYHDACQTLEAIKQLRLKDLEGREFTVRSRDLPDTKQIIIGSTKLRKWVEENFGRLSRHKELPIWLLGVQKSWRIAFLNGYTDGDGTQTESSVATGTASKALAVCIRLLATSLGYVASFHNSLQADNEIDGRTIKGGSYFRVVWRKDKSRAHFIDDERHRFTKVKKILPGSKQTVYCIEVEEDHSFVADGIVVHNCKHFSRAKGSKPVEKSIRSLAWIACKWASEVKPRMIFLENVREFSDWSPLVPRMRCDECQWKGTKGQAILMRVNSRCPRCNSKRLRETGELVPCPDRKGLTFRRFVGRLKNLGYKVEWKNLDAADYGAPTHRKRLFLIARCDGEPIVWPEPTHAAPHKINDMPLFGQLKPYRTAAECIDWSIPCPSIFERKRPLAEKTMRRIAHGIKRYVLDAESPFIVQVGYGERSGQTPRTMPVDEPIGTLVSTQKHAIVTPILSKYHGQKTESDSRCRELQEPFATLDTQPRFALVSPTLTRQFGKSDSSDISQPLPTIVAGGGGKTALVAAFVAKHFGGQVGAEAAKPLPTTTTRGTQNQLVTANLIHMNHGEKQWSSVEDPLRTVTSNNHAALVYAFLVKFFGTSNSANLHEPMPTATTKDRFGFVTVEIDNETYVITDIGMRMLTPRELARAQGFPETYVLTGTKTSQVARIGNSVCPAIAKAIVEANYANVFSGAK